MSRIDWAGLMRAGMTGLRLPPEVFWRLTPLELRLMLGAEEAVPPLTRARLDELARAFPDVRGNAGHGRNRNPAGAGRGAGGDTGGQRGDGGGL
jgi:uncharacterized phage protein (TIGR02216 family)